MIILILVALDRTHCERQFAYDTPTTPDLERQQITIDLDVAVVRSAHIEFGTESEGEGGDAHSVVHAIDSEKTESRILTLASQ